ncbi:nucleoside hydrolase [Streptococcus sp. S784/96/1]|uniref:nucleoside hydrolase n=1 Tax=Streptococcus sp. S784/96/1 TaxID=2653499 RepID=UPI00138A67DA|nr:nucleoside hydrolase [Streptococcus sp. S784/96/1]
MFEKLSYQVPESRKVRYIIHSDCKNEADDQFTVAHCLLTPRFEVKGLIAAHFDKNYGRYPAGTSAKASYDELVKVLEVMELISHYPVLLGAEQAMVDEQTPILSEGAQFIIDEAMKDDDRPLYIGMQGSLTDLASAILLKPEICQKMTAIWIGGGSYPDGGSEFNLMQDVHAANVVFQSDMPLWQVPANVYKRFAVSMAELEYKVKPYGKLGNYLFEELTELNMALGKQMPDFDWPHGEIWGLGDEGVVAALMQENQRTDLYTKVPAPKINLETMNYEPNPDNRLIRIYKDMDTRLTLEDLFCKIALFAK